MTLVFVALLIGLGVFSFYGNVLGDGGGGAEPIAPDGGAPASTVAPGETAGDSIQTQAGGLDAEQVVPASLAGLPVTRSVDGEEAKVQTEQLHGKALGQGFDAAWIAQYGGQGEGTLWVSRSGDETDAQTLMDRMSERIQLGTSPFQNFQTSQIEGTSIVSLDGMGQKHYYFRVGRDLYWLAMVPSSGEAALGELVANAREVAGR
jgi:hypothetical protein